MTAPVLRRPEDCIVGNNAFEMLSIWLAAKGARPAPRRQDITLAMVRGLSQWLWRVDPVRGWQDFHFRMAGDRIEQFYGRRFSGLYLSELYPATSPPDFISSVQNSFTQCMKQRAPQLVGPYTSEYPGKEHWEIEVLILPLSENGTDISSMIGTMEYWPLGTHSAGLHSSLSLKL
ncbi:MAG: PAS domain-containing protein [Rhizomicrobium sp.]